MGESRIVDDMFVNCGERSKGYIAIYSNLKPPLAVCGEDGVAWDMAWRPYLGSEIALPQTKRVTLSFRVASDLVVLQLQRTSPESPKPGGRAVVAP